MNNRFLRVAVVALLTVSISVLVLASRSGSSNDDSSKLRRELLIKVIDFAIENAHYDPGKIDDGFSEKVFENYIKNIDFGKRFLLQEDIDRLSKYKESIDDEFLSSQFEFLDLSVDILNKRIDESAGYYKEILAQPFDFSKEESYELDPDKVDFAADKAALKERWRKSLKYETLTRMHTIEENQEKAAEKSDTVTLLTHDQIEAKARGKILKRYNDWYHRMGKLNDDDRLNVYVNSIVTVFDPHTQYFPPRDKENFDIRFSGQLEGIGAQLTQKNDYVEVSRIIPGSPSWKEGELEVGDDILKVAQGDEEPVDIVDMRLDDAVQLIRGKKGTTVNLTVKKPDGLVKVISIVRDVVVLEETYAKSALLKNDETGDKYGYIKLPSFYVDFSKINGKNCFDDVKVELAKLKEEHIDGLIFDLRDNGGGSLQDVVKIAGLFIKDGPVVQSSGKNGKKKVYTDTDSRVQYDGPLVVMVNATSASASEIFAAAMQDYDRAIIIGGNSTFGKGTVQNFTELDRMVPKKPYDMKDLGSLKMTIQKFYRINGGATQLKGVTPDIILPDYYNYMEIGEKDMDYPMKWDEITPLEWDEWTPTYNEKMIVEQSKHRVSSDSTFALIDENGKRLEAIREQTNIDLDYDDFEQIIDAREQDAKKYKKIGKDTLGLHIAELAADVQAMEADTSKQARREAWVTDLKKDIYLYEAYLVMNDIENQDAKSVLKEE